MKTTKTKSPAIDPAEVPELKDYFFKWLQAEQEVSEAQRKADYFKGIHKEQLAAYIKSGK